MTTLQKTLVCLCIAGASSCFTLFLYREFYEPIEFLEVSYEDNDVLVEELDDIAWEELDEEFFNPKVKKTSKYKTYLI